MIIINKGSENLNRKIILIRLDLNVPLKKKKIQDFNRINKIIPTLNYLLKKKSKLILISHIGRPNGKKNTELSLKPICKDLSIKLSKKIRLIKKNIYDLNKKDIFKNNEKIVMLENIRFYKEEENNDIKFSKHLASLGDIYVNEAFSCSHRPHASVYEITKHIKSFAGIHLAKEVGALLKITSNITRPVTCIIGGSKISTKINIIKNLIPKFDNIIVVGGMANNLLKYDGYKIGKSIFEKNCEEIIKKIFDLAKKNNCTIYYPEDVSTGKNLKDAAINKNLNEVHENELILDIGTKTISKILNIIRRSKTVLWNGPAGYFENKNFANGSYKIAKEIANQTKLHKTYSVIGGGDTVAVINKLKIFKKINFVSTAGGAFLEYLEGKKLPGIESLN